MKYAIHPYVLTNGRMVDEMGLLRTDLAVDFAATARSMPKKPKLELVPINFPETCGFIQAAPHDRTKLCECRQPASHFVRQARGGMFLCSYHAQWVADCIGQEVEA